MAISRKKKEELVEQYAEQLEQSAGILLSDYSGLKVHEVEQIRRKMRAESGHLQIIKNRLLMLAIEQAGFSIPEEYLTGPTAVAFCHEDVPPVAKILSDAAKDHDALQIKGGLLGETVLTIDDTSRLADLPSREALLSQVLGTINAPATQTAGVIASGVRQVLNVLQAHVDKLEESQAAA